MSPTIDQIRTVPKVLLHDHLDGGLRPETVIELARETGYDGLPTDDPARFAAAIEALDAPDVITIGSEPPPLVPLVLDDVGAKSS